MAATAAGSNGGQQDGISARGEHVAHGAIGHGLGQVTMSVSVMVSVN